LNFDFRRSKERATEGFLGQPDGFAAKTASKPKGTFRHSSHNALQKAGMGKILQPRRPSERTRSCHDKPYDPTKGFYAHIVSLLPT
jgi:hypothetical protein